MKVDYLILDNAQKFRVEVNWNSIVDFCELKGTDDLASIDNIANMRLGDVSPLIWACVREGERMDGNDFAHTVKDFSARLKPHNIKAFMEILHQQVHVTGEREEVKKKMSFFKKKS